METCGRCGAEKTGFNLVTFCPNECETKRAPLRDELADEVRATVLGLGLGETATVSELRLSYFVGADRDVVTTIWAQGQITQFSMAVDHGRALSDWDCVRVDKRHLMIRRVS